METKLRVLITQSTFVNIGGSEVQAIELAKYLRDQGCEVTLYCWATSNPMENIIRNEGYELLTRDDPEAQLLRPEQFDLLWIQHSVIPSVLLESFDGTMDDSPLVIFAHMSPYKELHIEYPYQQVVEQTIADLVVFNSVATRRAQANYFSNDEAHSIYPNPAPSEFVESEDYTYGALRKVLVVSNHPPTELSDALELLERDGIAVDFLGKLGKSSHEQIVTADYLAQYDCVISIGKTVQYCLVQGIPVFVYDRFGGPGYLNDTNLSIAEQFNFSGRSKDDNFSIFHAKRHADRQRMTAEEIKNTLCSQFRDAQLFHQENRKKFISQFAISRCFERIYDQAAQWREKKNQKRLTEAQVSHAKLIQAAFADFHLSKTAIQREFYSQEIQIFSSQNQDFSEECSIRLPSVLHRHTLVEINPEKPTIRLDLGELPCVISKAEVYREKNGPLPFTINADIIEDNTYYFLNGDPQIIFDVPPENSQPVMVECDIMPLSSADPQRYVEIYQSLAQVLGNNEDRINGLEAELLAIKNSRLWRIRHALGVLYRKIRF